MRSFLSLRMIRTYIVIALACTAVFFFSPRYFSRFLYKPPGTVFVGVSAYFEDFYYYLDQFYQGKQGNWLTENRFSIEHFPPTLVYFNHLLMGKLGGLMGLESFETYNVFGLIFKLFFIISAYFLIQQIVTKSFVRQLTVFLFFLLSTALPDIVFEGGTLHVNPTIEIFRSANHVLSRFGTSPGGMFVNVLFVVLVLVLLQYYRKEISSGPGVLTLRRQLQTRIRVLPVIGIALAFSLLILGDLVVALVLLLSCCLLLIVNKVPPKRAPVFYTLVLLLTVLVCGLGLIFVVNVQSDPVYRMANHWDISQYLSQIKIFGVYQILKGFGLQLPIGLFGLYLMTGKRNKTVFEQLSIVIVCIAFLGYFVPIFLQLPILGFRFLFPAVYIFLSVFVLYTFEFAGKHVKPRGLVLYLVAGYLCINIAGFARSWIHEFKAPKEPDAHFDYIPVNLYNGLLYLRTAKPLDGNVLASSTTSIDLMMPGIAGRYTYSGHSLMTYRAETKDNNSSKFIFNWTDGRETRDFLRLRNIRFIFITSYTNQIGNTKKYYPFLKVVYENPMVAIFRYDPD